MLDRLVFTAGAISLFDHLASLPYWSWWIVLAAVFIVAFLYVGGPILVRFRMRQTPIPTFEEVDLTKERLPEPVDAFFRQVSEELSDVGFSVAGYLLSLLQFFESDNVNRPQVMMAVFENRAAQDTAIASVTYARSREGRAPRIKDSYLAFGTEFCDGSVIETSNTVTLRAFAQRPDRAVVDVPKLRSASHLYRVHKHLVERRGSKEKVLRLGRQDLIPFMQDACRRELVRQAEAGYFYFEKASGVYRPTWRGAVLMTWKLLWPLSSIQRARTRRRAAKLLRELGM